MKITQLGGGLVMLVALGCGGDSEGTGSGSGSGGAPTLPEATVTMQEAIGSGAWDEVVAQSQDLQQLVTEAGGAGYSTLAAAGVTKSDTGATLTWGVLARADDVSRERIFALACDADGACVAGQLDAQTASFTLADGATVDPPLIVAPALVKDLDGKDHDGKTTIASALTVEEVPPVDLRRRRLVIANAYGRAHGVDLSGWASMASATGAFTDVEATDYAGAGVIEDALASASPIDALVWFGASVRESVGAHHKTVGMTVNRGIYGDATFTASRVKALLGASAFGGPGLIVLVGEETRGDGSSEENENLSLFKEMTDIELGRVVVGMRGRPGAAKSIEATGAFLAAYVADGKSLADAIEAGNALLEGTDAMLVSSRESAAAEIFFLGSLDSLWDGGSPKEVRSTHFVNIANKCFDADGNVYSEPEGQASFFLDVDFDGPFFSGTRTSPDVDLDVAVEGVLLGREPGDRLYVRMSGTMKGSIRDLTVWGTGVVDEETDPEKPERMFYGGQALATDYTNDKGDTCVLLSPTLTGSTSQKSWMDLP